MPRHINRYGMLTDRRHVPKWERRMIRARGERVRDVAARMYPPVVVPVAPRNACSRRDIAIATGLTFGAAVLITAIALGVVFRHRY
jgi:hypothetical protein